MTVQVIKTDHQTFHQFSKLPPELRYYIWQYALPKDPPAIFHYRKEPWHLRKILPSHPHYCDWNEENNEHLEYRHELLKYTQVKAPAALFVNREARCQALAWCRRENIEMRFCEERQCHVFMRQFDRTHDILYFALDEAKEFCDDSRALMMKRARETGQGVCFGMSPTRIAIPGSLLRGENDLYTILNMNELLRIEQHSYTIGNLAGWFEDLEMIYVILNPQPEWEDEDIQFPQRWEVQSGKETKIVYDRTDIICDMYKCFQLDHGDRIIPYKMYKKMKRCLGDLAREIQFKDRFEVRPVFAVGK